jgi:hypothetical protein
MNPRQRHTNTVFRAYILTLVKLDRVCFSIGLPGSTAVAAGKTKIWLAGLRTLWRLTSGEESRKAKETDSMSVIVVVGFIETTSFFLIFHLYLSTLGTMCWRRHWKAVIVMQRLGLWEFLCRAIDELCRFLAS